MKIKKKNFIQKICTKSLLIFSIAIEPSLSWSAPAKQYKLLKRVGTGIKNAKICIKSYFSW